MTRNVNNAIMKMARGTHWFRIGNAVAIVSTIATVMAASARPAHPNQRRIDAMNPANGPKASSIYA